MIVFFSLNPSLGYDMSPKIHSITSHFDTCRKEIAKKFVNKENRRQPAASAATRTDRHKENELLRWTSGSSLGSLIKLNIYTHICYTTNTACCFFSVKIILKEKKKTERIIEQTTKKAFRENTPTNGPMNTFRVC